jgi:mannose-6-phosphate isomerase-like protein (cupin superfamily)
MSRSEPPRPGLPTPLAMQRVVRCLPADFDATQSTLDLVRPGPASGDLSYLDRLIPKPWGSEFRVYEDALTEVWWLHIAPQHRTSLHCHPNKRSALLCLEGKGTLSTCTGVRYALEPGVVVHIERGAYHRSASSDGTLTLLEVETPKDKFDLLRIDDDYRPVTEPYEDASCAALRVVERDRTALVATPLALAPFELWRLGAHRWARLRTACATSRHRFAVEGGERVRTSIDLEFAIALEPRAAADRELEVLAADWVFAAAAQTSYLTIRRR